MDKDLRIAFHSNRVHADLSLEHEWNLKRAGSEIIDGLDEHRGNRNEAASCDSPDASIVTCSDRALAASGLQPNARPVTHDVGLL